MKDYIIREIKQTELPKLSDFLYEAIFQPDEQNLLPREVILTSSAFAGDTVWLSQAQMAELFQTMRLWLGLLTQHHHFWCQAHLS